MDRRIYENYVLKVAECGSLTKAAASFGVTQPALSSGIASLEKYLGYAIFNRKTNPISFTAEGELYYDFLKRRAVLETDLDRRIGELTSGKNSHISVGAPVVYVDSILADAVIGLRREHPDYSVSIKCEPMSELIRLASSGELNCFISTSSELPSNLECKPIGKEQIYLCIPRNVYSKAQALGQSEQPRIKDLDGCSFILLEEGQPLQERIDRFFEANGIRPKCNIRVNQVSTALNLAMRGEGICFASESALAGIKCISNECIDIYPLTNDVTGRDLYIAYDRELFMPEACKQLIDILAVEMP